MVWLCSASPCPEMQKMVSNPSFLKLENTSSMRARIVSGRTVNEPGNEPVTLLMPQ